MSTSLVPRRVSLLTIVLAVALVAGLIATVWWRARDLDRVPAASDTTHVNVYFANPQRSDACEAVYPVSRVVPDDEVLTATIEQLLAGPTPAEVEEGFGGWFSAATADRLRGVTLRGGVAYVDLRDLRTVVPGASSSCGSAGLLAQLDRTVMSIPGVVSARYSIDGDEASFYEWLQVDVPD